MSSSPESIVIAGASAARSSSTTAPASWRPDLGDAPRDGLAVRGLELGVQLDVDPLRLADLARELVDRVADADDLRVRELERLEHRLLGHLVGAGLDHRQRVARADDDQVERRTPPSAGTSG